MKNPPGAAPNCTLGGFCLLDAPSTSASHQNLRTQGKSSHKKEGRKIDDDRDRQAADDGGKQDRLRGCGRFDIIFQREARAVPGSRKRAGDEPVSYTHLTLPTITAV